MNNKTKTILKILIFTALLLTLGFLLPQSIGLSAGGFDSASVLQQYNFYISGAIFLLIVVIFCFIELFINKGDSKYGDSVAYYSQGESPSLKFFRRFSGLQLFLLSTIIFSILGFVAIATKQETFTAFATLQHQFTPISSIIYSAFLIIVAENAGAAAIIAISFFSIRYLARKYDWSKATFVATCYAVIPLLVGIYGYLNHLLRYGDSAVSKSVVFVFWYIGGFITVLTGNFIPFAAMHQDNNLFYDLQRLYSNDVAKIATIAILLIIIFIYYLIYFVFKKKKETEVV